jgi:hypothetical protein
VCAVLATLLPVLTVVSATSATSATSTTSATVRRAATGRVAVPALLAGDRIRAQLPAGGTVVYHLPTLPDGGVRVLGDWNGDGVQTTGIFAAGRWQLSNQVQRPESPGIGTAFGQAGDVPVTGDWNGDGVTDIGVVRGAHWILALGPLPADGSSPAPWRDVTFGDGTGTPVTGDWDGNGSDGIGVYHVGSWVLANSVADPTKTVTVGYGTTGDRPVVGDWDGDGTDGIGVVRGTTWDLSNSLTKPITALHPVFAPGTTETPAAWQVADAPGATTCPTARNRRSGKPAWVVPSGLLDPDLHRGVGTTARRVRASLESSERFLLGAQFKALWSATRTRAYLDLIARPRNDELAIRLPAMSALTVAIGLGTGAYDRAVVRRPRSAGYHYVDQLVRSIACAHASVSPGGWGRGWETPHWAMLTGAAAWLVWPRLTPQTQADVTSMVVDEADRLTHEAVPYWGLPDGTILTPGDTKAEEDSWNSSLLAFAASMMPRAPHAPLWRAKSAELAVAAFATHPELSSNKVVNGVPLSARLRGFNAYANGTVENHQRIHPDYASNIQLLWTSADFDRLAGQRVPVAMFHHAALVYSAFSTLHYAAGTPSPAGGTYKAPGGTVYAPGHSWIYYPQGDDWGTARRAHFVSLDAHAMVYARYVRNRGWAAGRALAWHETGQQALVRGSGTTDGRTYSLDPAVAAQQDTYPGREEYAAQNLATAWLALYIGRIGLPELDRGTLPVPRATTKAAPAPKSARLAP